MEYIKLTAEGNVGVLTINRPAALNALNDQVIRELNEALDSIDLDTVRCLVVTGEGQKAFVAGADIGQMRGLTKEEGVAFGAPGFHPRGRTRKSEKGRRQDEGRRL